MRRSEELPWHYQSDRRWHALKSYLVQLDTFKLMYTSPLLSNEYMEYMLKLSQGPMFTSDEGTYMWSMHVYA